MKEVLEVEDMDIKLKEEAFTSMGDLLIFFKPNDSIRGSVLAPLVYRPDAQLHAMMNNFIQDHVFINEEDDKQVRVNEPIFKYSSFKPGLRHTHKSCHVPMVPIFFQSKKS